MTKGGSINNFMLIIMDALIHNGGVAKEEITSKLLSFGVDGVSMF